MLPSTATRAFITFITPSARRKAIVNPLRILPIQSPLLDTRFICDLVSTIPFLQTSFEFLTARNGANDQERLCPRRNGIGQGRIRWFMRQVLPASEESH